ncbi:hypothetical protein SELMODRAFT_102321, partial [Selaginella moellendorffii]
SKHLFDRMRQRDLISWNSPLGLRPHKAGELFYRMPERNILLDMVDEVCFVSALIACSRRGKTEDGRCCLVSMIGDFVLRGSKQHYSCMVDALARSGRLRNSEELIATMPFVPRP